MTTQFLYDYGGEWIAFRIGNYVYDSDAEWIGWLPWGDQDVVTVDGDYLGTIHPNNRFYKLTGPPYRGYPGYPGYGGYSPLPLGAVDVVIPKKNERSPN